MNRSCLFFQGIAEKGLYALVIALPLAFYTGAFWPFDTPKVALLRVLTVIILGAWVGKALAAGEFRVARPAVVLPVLAYAVVFLLTTLTSISPTLSFFGDGGRNDGLLTIANLLLFYFLAPSVLTTAGKRHLCLKLLLLGGAIVSVIGILQYFGVYWPGWPPPPAGRANSTLSNPDFLFSYLSLLIPVTAAVTVQSRHRVGLVRLLGPIGLMAMVLCLVLTLPSAARQLSPQKDIAAAMKVEPAAILKATPGSIESSLAIRLRDWRTVLETIGDRPLLGSGPNTLKHTFTRYQTLERTSTDYRLDKAHNEFLETASTMGLIGLAVYLWLLAALGWRLFRTAKAGWGSPRAPLAAGLMVAFLAYVGQSNVVFHTVVAYLTFWLVLALGMALTETEERPSLTWRFSLPGRGLVLFVSLISLLVVWLSYLAVRPVVADIYFLRVEQSKTQEKVDVMEKVLLGDKVLRFNGYEPLYNTTFAIDLAEASNHVGDQELRARLVARAMERATGAIALSPYDANLYFVRAMVRLLAEPAALTAIIEDLNQALELYPYYYQANLMLAEMEKKRGNYGRAIAARELAIRVVPDNGRIIFALGDDYFMAGDFTKAIETWEKARELIPEEPRVHVGLGRAYERKGDRGRARQHYEIASSLKPDLPGLVQALERVRDTGGK